MINPPFKVTHKIERKTERTPLIVRRALDKAYQISCLWHWLENRYRTKLQRYSRYYSHRAMRRKLIGATSAYRAPRPLFIRFSTNIAWKRTLLKNWTNYKYLNLNGSRTPAVCLYIATVESQTGRVNEEASPRIIQIQSTDREFLFVLLLRKII